MKEGELKPGDQVDQWIVKEPIGGGAPGRPCVYSVYRRDEPGKLFAMKIREPNLVYYFKDEVQTLKSLNEGAGHPSFQRLVGCSDNPAKLYMILAPLMPPERNFFKVHAREFSDMDIHGFLIDFFEALSWAASKGIRVGEIRHKHLFLTDDKKPFFLGLSDEPHGGGSQDHFALSIGLLASILYRFIDGARLRALEEARKPVFNFTLKR